jgi:ElaB/YqjD/DUF883 family membrane-anchored ribosome-binding protein
MDNNVSDTPLDATADRARSTVDRAAQTAHETIDRLAAKAGPAVDRLRRRTTGTADTLRAKADALGELEEQWADNARAYVRENPLTALALGVLAGVLLSKLSSSR